MKFVISWISFFDNKLGMKEINAESEQEALEEAFRLLVQADYTSDGGSSEDIKQAAFDCDGMIGALEIK